VWIGKEAPTFNLPDLDRHHVNLSAMRGKAVLLDFWATWCVPGIEEMPIIEKIENEYRTRGLEI
jgi:thiol-disulfide isomerase/thioredoxin